MSWVTEEFCDRAGNCIQAFWEPAEAVIFQLPKLSPFSAAAKENHRSKQTKPLLKEKCKKFPSLDRKDGHLRPAVNQGTANTDVQAGVFGTWTSVGFGSAGLTAGINDLRGPSQPKWFCVRGTAEILHGRWWPGWFSLILGHFCTVVCSQGSASITAGVKLQTCLIWCWKMKDTEDFLYFFVHHHTDDAHSTCPGPSSTAAFSTHSIDRDRSWEREKGRDTHKTTNLSSPEPKAFLFHPGTAFWPPCAHISKQEQENLITSSNFRERAGRSWS